MKLNTKFNNFKIINNFKFKCQNTKSDTISMLFGDNDSKHYNFLDTSWGKYFSITIENIYKLYAYTIPETRREIQYHRMNFDTNKNEHILNCIYNGPNFDLHNIIIEINGVKIILLYNKQNNKFKKI